MKDNSYVSETPGVCGGYPVVRGTRIPVRILVGMYHEYGDLAEILAAYPHLTAEQVQGALDYYAAYPARVDEDITRHARALAELQGR
jgi:uncharacterized protein (DUF433 family)